MVEDWPSRPGVLGIDAKSVDDRVRVCERQPVPAWRRRDGHGGPAYARLPRPVVAVVFAGADAIGTEVS
jgi:hypothetical protein